MIGFAPAIYRNWLLMMQEKSIPYGTQFRDDDRGIIVNWYPKRGKVVVQKNSPALPFPTYATHASELRAIFEMEGLSTERPDYGLCVDAGTRGNPGEAEYKITDIDGRQIYHETLGVHSNNYAELAGIMHAVQYAQTLEVDTVWTDSQISIGWIESGKIGETVRERAAIIAMADVIRDLLADGSVELRKWDTGAWGEIPADFGRKGASKKKKKKS